MLCELNIIFVAKKLGGLQLLGYKDNSWCTILTLR